MLEANVQLWTESTMHRSRVKMDSSLFFFTKLPPYRVENNKFQFSDNPFHFYHRCCYINMLHSIQNRWCRFIHPQSQPHHRYGDGKRAYFQCLRNLCLTLHWKCELNHRFFVCHSSNSERHFFHIQSRVWILKCSRLGESRWWNQKLPNRGNMCKMFERKARNFVCSRRFPGSFDIAQPKKWKRRKIFFSFLLSFLGEANILRISSTRVERKSETNFSSFSFHIQQILNISWWKCARVTGSEEWVFARDGLLSARKHSVLEVDGLLKTQV